MNQTNEIKSTANIKKENAAVVFDSVTKTFKKALPLDNISFKAYKGEVLGIVCQNLFHRKNLLKIMMGIISPDMGSVTICGADIKADFEGAMSKISGNFDEDSFYEYMSGFDNLMLYARARGCADKKKVKEAVSLVGLEKVLYKKVKIYSSVMKKKLSLAQGIITPSEVLILDEPSCGFSPYEREKINMILNQMAKKDNRCVIITGSSFFELEQLCDKLLFIENGVNGDLKNVSSFSAMLDNTMVKYVFNVSDSKKAELAISSVFSKHAITHLDCQTLMVTLNCEEEKETVSRINKAIVLGGIELYSVFPYEEFSLKEGVSHG